MPPVKSSREKILEYLRTELFTRIVESAGYNNTVKTVERGRRNPKNMGEHEFPALFIASTQEKRKNLNQIHFDATLQVVVVGYVMNTKGTVGGDGTGTQLDLDRLIQDAARALETEPLLGGDKKVKWLEVTEVTTDEGDLTPYGWFVMSINVEYAGERTAP